MTSLSWKPKKLDELGFVGRGKSRHRPRNAPELYEGKYPFIQTANIMASELYIHSYSQTYSELGFSQSKMWKKGTLCMTIAGENTAETAILGFDACFPDSVIGFVADSELSDVRFVKYYLDTIKPKIKSVTKGATQDNLSLDKLLSFDLIVPDVEGQRRIADILSAYDDLIEVNTRRIRILEGMAQSIYREWFGKVDEQSIPDGWKLIHLDEFIDIQPGYSFKSGTFIDNGMYKIVTIKNVQDGVFLPTCDNEVSKLPDNMPLHCHLNMGDILLSLTGNVGRTCLVYGNQYLLNQRVAKLAPKEITNRAFIYLLFRLDEFRARLSNVANGVAQQNISLIEMAKIKIVVPPRENLLVFSASCEPMIEQMLKMLQINANLRKTRDLLLPRLVSGEIDVSEVM